MDDFIELADLHAATDYADKNSVKNANVVADKMSELVSSLNSSAEVEKYLSLLTHPNAGSWVAFLLADLSTISKKQRNLCIKKVKSIADGDGVNSLGAQMWLSERGF